MPTNIANKITDGCNSYTSSINKMAGNAVFGLSFSQPTIDPLNPNQALTDGPTIGLVADKFVHELVLVKNLVVQTGDVTEADIVNAGPATVINPITSAFNQPYTLVAANIANSWKITFDATVKMFDGKEFTNTYTVLVSAEILWPGLSL